MKLEYLRELMVLAKHRNYTRAAEELYLTQPALSKHIDLMEKELGTCLVRRNTHQVELTEDGQEAVKAFQKMIRLYDNYVSDLEQKRTGLQGMLRIGMLYYTIQQDLGKALPAFRKQYPKVTVQTISGQPQEIYQALIDEKIDLGVLPPANYPHSDIMMFHVFARTGASVMLAADHPLSEKEFVTLEELTDETFILLKDDPYTTLFINEALARCSFTPKKTAEADHIDTVPFTILETGGIHINGSGFTIPGYEDEIRVIPIQADGLYFEKAFCWCKANQNPTIPVFLQSLPSFYANYNH